MDANFEFRSFKLFFEYFRIKDTWKKRRENENPRNSLSSTRIKSYHRGGMDECEFRISIF